ncbi:glycosyltransferase family 4 protein [Gammaproteobacteria bacterium]|nr:glycosyltransferase family 4 protein [Gammaproteobacteria bacterium]
MKRIICVDGTPLCGNLTGIGITTKILLQRVARINTEFQFIVFAPYKISEFSEKNIIVNPIYSNFRTKHIFGWSIFWFDFILPRLIKKSNADIYWTINGTAPFFLSKSVNVALWIHDFVFHFYPKTMNLFPRIYRKLNFKYWGKRVKWRFCVSNSVASEMKELFNLNCNAITYPGIDEDFHNTTRKYNKLAKNQYFLVLGTLEPRKNLKQITKVVSSMVEEGAWPSNYKIKFVGDMGWRNDSLHSNLDNLVKQEVAEVLDFIPRAEVISLLSRAKALLMPSLYEGFGMPVAESLAAGCPVICSDIKPFREIDSHKNCIFHSFDDKDIKEVFNNIFSEKVIIPNNANAKGLAEFDWDITAAKFSTTVFPKKI